MDTVVQSYKVLTMIGKSPFSDDRNQIVGGEDTDGAVTKFNLWVIGTLALVAVGSGIASMVLTVSTIVDVACVCLFVVAPTVVVQKMKLRKLGTLRNQQNKLRIEVNKFAEQNEHLKNSNIQLDLECTELQSVSAEYTALTQKHGAQVDRLLAIIMEQGEIQAKIIKSLEAQIMQQAMDTILKSDTNQDFAISCKEIPILKLRMRNIPGVEFDEANFDRMFQQNDGELGLNEIMRLFHNLLDDIPEEDNVFHLKPEALLQKKSFVSL
ncbi:hypothetical protein IV203_021371 [Nitzschia inconspicua]|uniref:Uncharacterized protein n=1 Tax=Nitzschia inconspicua TaxID=303405 RepID=A0A9K3KHQ4_9STRA|nr:hypothetical protein IV203_021371 [Nitzschia inconspicua]